MVSSYKNGSDDAYTYAYDDNGNITSITQGTLSATYVYDEMNQLVRANDGFANLTTTYTYDLGGNITEKNEYAYTTGTLGTPTDTIAYTYDADWKDQLASYDGQAITYDDIGNPLSYRGYTMTWQGKRLSTLSGNGTSASYTYDEQGVRTSKTVNSVTTNFSYNGSLLMAQVSGSVKQLYSYDAGGQLVSVNYNGAEYYYLRNGQNDIVGIMDGSGTKVVEYTYDSWGKPLTVTGTLATTLGVDNPFRYRGYYDAETGLYYLQARYYDPEVCRFISADVYMTTGQGIVGSNMYAYCNNSPVILGDKQGTEAIIVICGVAFTAAELFALAVMITAVIDVIGRGEDSLPYRVSKGVIEGLQELVDTITAVLETTPERTYKSPENVHHIVAQNSPYAEPAREALKSVGLTTENTENLVSIKTSLHTRLHTRVYYAIINASVTSAAAGDGTVAQKRIRVVAVLTAARAILSTVSKLLKW